VTKAGVELRVPGRRRNGLRDLVLWAALLAALSPSLADLAQHWVVEPWARASALFVPLWLLCAWRDRAPRRPHADGYLLLALGLAVSLAAVGGGMARLGRPGIPLAVVGLARALGRPSPPCALVALWLIPVPDALVERLSPGLEAAVPALAAAVARAFGAQAEWIGGRLVAPAGALAFDAADGGLPLVWVLAGLGWYGAAARRGPLRDAGLAALRAAPWALAAQLLGLLAASGLVVAGRPAAAAVLLRDGVWSAAAAFGLWRAQRGTARARDRSLEPAALPRAGRTRGAS